VNKGY